MELVDILFYLMLFAGSVGVGFSLASRNNKRV